MDNVYSPPEGPGVDFLSKLPTPFAAEAESFSSREGSGLFTKKLI